MSFSLQSKTKRGFISHIHLENLFDLLLSPVHGFSSSSIHFIHFSHSWHKSSYPLYVVKYFLPHKCGISLLFLRSASLHGLPHHLPSHILCPHLVPHLLPTPLVLQFAVCPLHLALKNIAFSSHNQIYSAHLLQDTLILTMTSSRALYKYNPTLRKSYTACLWQYVIWKQRRDKCIVLNKEPDFLLIFRTY